MPLTLESASSPVYANASNTAIDLMVKFKEFAGPIAFTASPNDPESHGAELYANAVAGAYGAITPYVAPAPAPNTEGFVIAAKTALGGHSALVGNANLAVLALTVESAVKASDWTGAQALITASPGLVTSGQYEAIKAAAAANSIPVSL